MSINAEFIVCFFLFDFNVSYIQCMHVHTMQVPKRGDYMHWFTSSLYIRRMPAATRGDSSYLPNADPVFYGLF